MIKDLKVWGFDWVLGKIFQNFKPNIIFFTFNYIKFCLTIVEWKSKEAKITTNGKSEYIKIEDQSLQRAILLSYNDEDAILRQAENLRFRKFK